MSQCWGRNPRKYPPCHVAVWSGPERSHRSRGRPATPVGGSHWGASHLGVRRPGTRFWQRERGLAVPEGRSSELTEKGPLSECEPSPSAAEPPWLPAAQPRRGHGSRRDHSLDLAAGLPAGQAPQRSTGVWVEGQALAPVRCKLPPV